MTVPPQSSNIRLRRGTPEFLHDRLPMNLRQHTDRGRKQTVATSAKREGYLPPLLAAEDGINPDSSAKERSPQWQSPS